ncbi:unnamed protein product [Adineta steineri]|uniref:Fucosyltransferase n=1 Tax=Adineta steineri TaxID=433720 RepID=A0A818LY09_9BILA|nr:unnamed protein product [Adineta steineri]CAF3585988.1 unnamed protein product [Adineta steineri]
MVKRKTCIICMLWVIFLLIVSASLTLYKYQKYHTHTHTYQIETKIIVKPSKCEKNETVKYIFNLVHWRETLAKHQTLSKKNQTLWCKIPDELRLISTAIFRLYNIRNHTHLPCSMIYSSNNTLEDIKCKNNGQISKRSNDDSTDNQAELTCRHGSTLDLFINKSADYSYPSIIADALNPLSDDLYIDILNNKYRSCNTMWGFKLNHESISYYPSTTNPQKSNLFDVTFGYDRSIHEFIPHPWLYTYIEHIKFTPQRLSMQQVMNNKVKINSIKHSDIYWTNQPANSNGQNKRTNVSYVKSPILWMNSNCNTKSQRTQYMRRLMRFIDVDNYGTCGPNILPLPEHVIKIQGSANRTLNDLATYNSAAGKLALAKEYLFTIAIENSLTYDYITEKLWQPLAIGSIPIYLGAPNIHDWLPCQTDCIIDLNKFKTPQDAAMHIKQVAANRTLYESYHKWRDEPVSKKFQNILNYFTTMENYSLECILCGMSKQADQNKDPKEYKKKILKTIGRF